MQITDNSRRFFIDILNRTRYAIHGCHRESIGKAQNRALKYCHLRVG